MASRRLNRDRTRKLVLRGLVALTVAAALPGAPVLLGQVPPPPPAPVADVVIVQKAAPAQEKGAPAPAPNVTIIFQAMPLQAAPAKAQEKAVAGKAIPAQKVRPAEKAKPAAKVVAGKAVMKAAIIQRAMPIGVMDAQIAQYLQQFRPLARGEYYFVRNLCGLKGEDRKQLAAVAEQAARGAARQFVEAQQEMMRGGRGRMSYPDPNRLVEEEFGKHLDFLSTEQRERYAKERQLRAVGRRQVFIDNLIVKLDSELVLTSKQRQELSETLAKNWNESWCQSLEMLQNLDNFFPNIPDQFITPHLSEKQVTAWRRMTKNQGVFFGFGGGLATWDPDPLDDPEIAQARKAAEAKDKEKK